MNTNSTPEQESEPTKHQAKIPPQEIENRLYEEWKRTEGFGPGDLGPLTRAITNHAKIVCWMILRGESADWIQEMVNEVLLALPEFRRESSFSTWVHGIFLNYCYNVRRSRGRRRSRELRITDEQTVEGVNLDSIVCREIIAQQEPKDRKLLQMLVDGFSQEEIAQVFGLSREGIMWRKNHLFERLLRQYGNVG